MLILEETCGDTESRSKKPSVVARLMGLDSVPVQKSVASTGKVRDDSYLMNGLKAAFQQWQQQEASAYVETHHSSASEGDYRDVYEVEQQLKNAWVEERYPQKVRYEQDFYRRRLALARRKFMEVKHLATNGEPFDSEEFQDPVEVLNSNRDLFLKFLEEPNTVFSKHLFEPQGVSVSSGTTRITVLKPSNTTGRKGNKFIKRQLLSDDDETVGKVNRYCWSTGLYEQICHDLSGPTSIVVLKPTGGRSYDMKTIPSGDLASDQSRTSTDEVEVVHEDSLGDNLLLDEESLGDNRSNEGILSSESSDYIADDSSFDKSDSVYFDDEVGNASDLELATSATEDSWDYINKFASPLPCSSISQIPHSPEPSIIREAKKKLSERLAFVSSNINFLEQRYLSASRSTLGELLAVSEGSNKELTHSTKSFKTNDKYTEKNSQNLSRLKSLVVSSSTHGVDEFNVGISSSSITKPIAQTLVPKSKHRKLSLKDKVSSFFFSRSKRPSEDAHPGALYDVLSSFNATFLGDSNRSLDESMDLSTCPEGDPTEKSGISRNLTEYQDKCCPSSVSFRTFQFDNATNGLSQSSRRTIAGRPQLVSRSPPIESVARSVAAKSPDHFVVFKKADEEHEQFAFLQKLISSSGMDLIYYGWHSLHSPLDPYLLYEYLHAGDEDEKHRDVHSNRRLLFDSINAVLSDIAQSALLEVYPWTRALGPEPRKDSDSNGNATVAERVWAILRKGLASEGVIPKESACDSIVVDRVVKRDVTGRQWEEAKWLELCDFSKEVGGKVLEELVEDLLLELSCH